MSYDPVDDVDGEAVRRITGAVLRDEQQTPRAVVVRPCIGIRDEERAYAGDCDGKRKPFHGMVSEGCSGKQREHHNSGINWRPHPDPYQRSERLLTARVEEPALETPAML